jgi:hypothetical protein
LSDQRDLSRFMCGRTEIGTITLRIKSEKIAASIKNRSSLAVDDTDIHTTKLYDRTDDQITLDEVEKIGI